MPDVTFAALKTILLGLGFSERSVPGSHYLFQQVDSDALILLRPYRDDELVDQANLVITRKLLDEKGLLDRKRFDELLREHSLAS